MATHDLAAVCEEGTLLSLIEANWRLVQDQISIGMAISGLITGVPPMSEASAVLAQRLDELIANAQTCNGHLPDDSGSPIQLLANANTADINYFTPLLEQLRADFLSTSGYSAEFAELLRQITAGVDEAVSNRLVIHKTLQVAAVDEAFL